MSLPPTSHLPVDPAAPRAMLPPIPRWKIATGVLSVAVLTIAVVTVLWWAGTRGLEGKDLVTGRLDALRVGLSIGVAGGGLFALYLAWRRQRSTEADLDNRERALVHQLQVAASTEADAEARRVTELYTKSVEQLGSDKAPVRLGGLYALERLAQDNPGHRQTIVNIWCAYLRMPFIVPGEPPYGGNRIDSGGDVDAAERLTTANLERTQEREVRLAIQRLLSAHLDPNLNADIAVSTFWADINVDLTGAILLNFDFRNCAVRTASFGSATFLGSAAFEGATFADYVDFEHATFDYIATFGMAVFTGPVSFFSATFAALASFAETHFVASANFIKAAFHGAASFSGTIFDGPTYFRYSSFARSTYFMGAIFPGNPDFGQATFAEEAPAEVAQFLISDTPDDPSGRVER